MSTVKQLMKKLEANQKQMDQLMARWEATGTKIPKRKTPKFKPDYAASPGTNLNRRLDEMDMPCVLASLCTGIPRKTLEKIIDDRERISPSIVTMLAKVTGVSAATWRRLDKAYYEHGNPNPKPRRKGTAPKSTKMSGRATRASKTKAK